MSNIFVYGVPGVGKTYFARTLSNETKLKYIEADSLRKIAQKEQTEQENPFVYLGTTQAYLKFGDFTKVNVIKGLQAVRKAMNPYILQVLNKKGTRFLIEGAFLEPSILSNYARGILIVQLNEKIHYEQLFQHRQLTKPNLISFKVARVLQSFLIREADELEIPIKQSDGTSI